MSCFTKLKDLYTYEVLALQGMPEKVRRLAERVKQSGVVTVRRLDLNHPESDLSRMQAIFHTMLKPGFGFAPMSQEEFMSIVNRLRVSSFVRRSPVGCASQVGSSGPGCLRPCRHAVEAKRRVRRASRSGPCK